MVSDTLRLEEDAGERRFWEKILRATWTLVIVLIVAGGLAALTVALGWAPYLLLCALGLLTGISLSLALLGSARSRELTGLVLGAIALPSLAVWLTSLMTASPDTFITSRDGVVAFLVHAAGAVCGAVAIARVQRARPVCSPDAPGAPPLPPDEGGLA